MLLGGSGSLIAFPEILLQCLLAVLTAAWVWQRPDSLRQVPRGAWIIAALMLAVPLGQLLPLPPVVWHNLPGRAVERAALDLVGQESSWQPLSLTANRTLAALLAMMSAAAVLIMAAAQDRRGRTILLATGAGIALLSVLVGAAQLSGGDGNHFRFYNPTEAFLDGFQTNHNAEADVLLIGMVMLAAAAADWAEADRARHRQRGIDPARPRGPGRAVDPRLLLAGVVGASLLLVLGVALTASRTGIALLPIAVGAQGLILRRSLGSGPRFAPNKRRLAIATIAVVAVIGLAAVMLGQHGALAQVWARFHTPSEARPEIWRDALYALRQYWPWGAGMGSFIPVFAAAERLEVVSQQFVNRAHNDYLELLIEAGLPGLLVFGLICLQIINDAARSWRTTAAGSPAQVVCGAASLLIITAHSLGDYPLRTMSLACMTALCAGVLLPMATGAEPGNMKRS
jgi:O-antigen ligase